MNPTVNQIAQDIYTRARSKGIDPNFALGLALREGLTKNTVGSPTFGNRDAKGYSYGPWQLYSGSPVAGAVAPGGQAAQFMRQYGQRPSAANWQLQNEFALNLMKRLTPQQQLSTWYAIRDNGGHSAIARIGLQNAMKMGLTTPGGGSTPTTPGSVASAFTTPAGPPAPTTPGAPVANPVTPGSDPALDMPPPPPQDDPELTQLADLGDESASPEYSPEVGALDHADLATVPMEDMLPEDATVGLSDHIRQKSLMGKQRRAEMASPLGQLFAVDTFGKAGKGWA